MSEINLRRIIAPENFVNHWNEKMGDEEYHLLEDALGSSSVKIAIDSLAGFYSYFFEGIRPAPSKDQIIGTRVHMALLEPEKFRRKLVVMPTFKDVNGDTSMKKKENQRQRDEWLMDKPRGSVTVDQDELDQVTGIVKAILKHDQGLALVKDGRTELAGFARCPKSGLLLKIKCDFLSYDYTRFSDYKTTKSTIKRKFMNDVFVNYRYDFQLAYYLYVIFLITGKRPDLTTILASEKKPPYEPAAFYFTTFELERAEAQVIETLMKIREAIDTNVWPFRQQQIERAKAPKFLQDLDEEDDEEFGVA